MRLLDVTTTAGIPFRVVHYAPGESGPFPAATEPLAELIEFYDARDLSGRFTVHGQFVSRYLADTLRTDGYDGRGLDLDGGVSAWSIDAGTMAEVLEWLAAEVYPVPTYARVTRELPYSEVNMHMHVAGKVFEIEPLPSGMAQLWKDGSKFSFPITMGEAGISSADLSPADPLAEYDDDGRYTVTVAATGYQGTMSGARLKSMIRASTKAGKDLSVSDFKIVRQS